MPRISLVPLPGCPVFRALACDELGYIKGVESKSENSAPEVVCRWGEAQKSQASTSIEISITPFNLLAVGKKNGDIDVRNLKNGDLKAKIIPKSDTNNSENSVVSVQFLNSNDSGIGLLSCSEGGNLNVVQLSISGDDVALKNPEESTSSHSWSVTKSTSVNVTALKVDKTRNFAAIGGKGTEPSLWDLNQQSQIWSARGPKPDKLGLVPPAWTTSLTFANQEDSRKFLVGTAEHTWRLYDVAAQRRPVMVVPFGESSIKSIAASRDGFSLFLGNGTGNLAQFDIRTGKLLGGFKGGQAGSIRSVVLHPELPLMASGGLDRFIRFHSTVTRKLLGKVFMKQPVVQVLFEAEDVKLTNQENGQNEGKDSFVEDVHNPEETELIEITKQDIEALQLKPKRSKVNLQQPKDPLRRSKRHKKISTAVE